jgi:GNAT superfamily N-acetyltransferase
MGISTRPAVASDEEFVNALTRETMRPYVQATWPSDEEREKYYWINRFQQNETEIIQVDREDAGRITITRRPGCIVLEEIHIAPRFQGRGIGQMLIRKVLAEADERRIPTELKVLKKNPAQKLYMRLGFVTVRDADERLYMVRGIQQVEVADASTRRNS